MKYMPKALELDLRDIAIECRTGRISWDTKEYLLDITLEMYGWTRQDLRDYNEERENDSYQSAN